MEAGVVNNLFGCSWVLWLNPSGQLSPTQALAHSFPWERIRMVKVKQLEGWDRNSLIGKTKAVHTAKQNKELMHSFPSSGRCSASLRKVGLRHVCWLPSNPAKTSTVGLSAWQAFVKQNACPQPFSRSGVYGFGDWRQQMKPLLEVCCLSRVSFWAWVFEMLITVFHLCWLFDFSVPRNVYIPQVAIDVLQRCCYLSICHTLRLTCCCGSWVHVYY